MQLRGTAAAAARARGRELTARVWFTADTHFGHGGALGLFRRPFASVTAMNAAMIAGWNEIVAADDLVWHLGDVAVGPKPEVVGSVLEGLHGRKRLVAGNADGAGVRELPHWEAVHNLVELTEDGRRLVLCHYPLRTWNGMGRGAWQLHGHSHGRLAPLPAQVDVGVDVWGFRPVDLATLRARRRAPPARDRA